MKKRAYAKWFFLVFIIVVIAILAIIGTHIKKPSKTTTVYTNIETNGVSISKEKIIIEKLGVVHKDTLVISIKNNNNAKVVVDNIFAIIKDESGNFLKRINCLDSNIPINGGQETVSYVWNDDDENLADYSNIEFGFEINDSKSGLYPADLYICDNFEINVNNTGKQIAVTIQNNNSDSVLASINVVFYKDSKVVGFSSQITDEIEANEKGYVNLEYPYNENNGNKIRFDDYKVNFVKAKIQ